MRRSNKKHQKRSSVKRPVLSLYEMLEPRVLLNGYTFTIADQGSDTANGDLKNLFNGSQVVTSPITNHVLALGDTILLATGARGDGSLINWSLGNSLDLPNLGAAAAITLNGSGGVSTGSPAIKFTGGNYGSSGTYALTFIGGSGSGAAGTATIKADGVTGLSWPTPARPTPRPRPYPSAGAVTPGGHRVPDKLSRGIQG